MKTTEVVVELVVVGSGVLGIALIHAHDVSPHAQLTEDFGNSILLGFFMFVCCYVAGIVIDRLADVVFSPIEDIIRRRYFESIEAYQKFRAVSLDSSERMRDWSRYNRVRARVCRGWVVNSLFFAIYFLWSDKIIFFSSPWMLVPLAGVLFLSWLRLTIKEVEGFSALKLSEE